MTRTKAQLVKVTRNFKWLQPAFKHLKTIIDSYIDWDGEPPYWNNEAASVSLLIAAASRARYDVALADYRRDKWVTGKDSKGRCDLYLGNANRYLEIEAKQFYFRANTKVKTIKKNLQRARAASKQLWGPGERAGLLFVVLSLSPDEAKTYDVKNFKEAIASVKSDVLWYWYDSACDKEVFRSYEAKRYFPALAILMRK